MINREEINGKDLFDSVLGIYFNKPETEVVEEVKIKKIFNEKPKVKSNPFYEGVKIKEPLREEPQHIFNHSELDEHSITKYMKRCNIVGEEALGTLITVLLADKNHIILEGMSGTGKTYIMDGILKLFDPLGIYEIQLTSKQALWQQTEEINSNQYIYIPELQKAVADKSNRSSSIIEFLKNITEGKDAKRIVTNSTRDGIDSYVIEKGKTIVSTIAKENDFKYDRETQRRFVILETDNSLEHIDNIINNVVRKNIELDLSLKDETIAKNLMERVQYVAQLKEVYVLNPFLNYFKNMFPVVEKTQSYLNHYINLFSAWGKFFEPERTSFTIDEKKFVMLDLKDNFNIYNMYQSHFIKTLESFNGGTEIKTPVPDWYECLNDGIKIARENLSVKIDKGIVNVGDTFSGAIDSWIKNQSQGGVVYTTDFKTGDKVAICGTYAPGKRITNPAYLLKC